MSDTVLGRIQGALYGVAFGDAMGMPVEMFSQRKIREDYGIIEHLMPGAPDNPITRGFVAGEVTDDTMMTMLCCQHLIEHQGVVEPRAFINRIIAWAEANGKSRLVVGPSSRIAFEKIAAGMPVEEAGRTGITNGAAMKVSPIGMITRPSEMDLLLERVHNLCIPTHNTSAAVSGAMAVAGAVSLAIEGEKDLNRIFDFAITCAHMGETRGAEVIGPCIADRLEFVRGTLKDFNSESNVMTWVYNVLGSGLPIVETVPAAFAMLMFGGADLLKCASLCASTGGDTDTIASIACAMAGALRGADAIPMASRVLLSQVNSLNIEKVAEGLFALRCI